MKIRVAVVTILITYSHKASVSSYTNINNYLHINIEFYNVIKVVTFFNIPWNIHICLKTNNNNNNSFPL